MCRILEDKTQNEAFIGVKPEVSHFSHFWLSSLYSYREEDQVGGLQQEGFVCGL
jgi:hypothetical protein